MLQRPQRVPSLEANAEFSGVGDGIEDHQPSSIRDLRPNTTVKAHLEEAAGEVARIANRANARTMRGQRAGEGRRPRKDAVCGTVRASGGGVGARCIRPGGQWHHVEFMQHTTAIGDGTDARSTFCALFQFEVQAQEGVLSGIDGAQIHGGDLKIGEAGNWRPRHRIKDGGFEQRAVRHVGVHHETSVRCAVHLRPEGGRGPRAFTRSSDAAGWLNAHVVDVPAGVVNGVIRCAQSKTHGKIWIRGDVVGNVVGL